MIYTIYNEQSEAEMKITRKNSSTLSVDIHGMRERDAKFRLESLIENSSADITKLEIIHGFNGGTVLQSLVRSGLKSKRIKEIRPGDNSGKQ